MLQDVLTMRTCKMFQYARTYFVAALLFRSCLCKVISALFGHSVYLRFRDLTTDSALTTIGRIASGMLE